MSKSLTFVLLLLTAPGGYAQAQKTYREVFVGYPSVKTQVQGDTIARWPMQGQESTEYACRIVIDEDGNYFWASREMKPMVKAVSGIYVTYISDAGYVRTYVDRLWTDLASDTLLQNTARVIPTDMGFEYMENLYTGLAGIVYHGRRSRFEKSSVQQFFRDAVLPMNPRQ